MAVFGIPRVHEDDALRAVRAAAEIRERLPVVAAEVGVELRFRTGVNTGAVLMGEGENLAIGDAVNVAARFEQVAEPGEIVVGEGTLRLVRDAAVVEELEPLELKGKAEPVRAYRLVSVDPAAPGFARHLDAPLVGRQRELRLLREAWDRTVEESGCHLFTLLGAAGVDKSRLVAELLSAVDEGALLLRGRCLPYGEGITFWPLVEALMPVGEVAEAVLERLNSGTAATRQELFWEVRRLLESIAAERPVILRIEDLHWAEPMLLDLLDHVTDLSRGAPILLLCTARPEVLEDRPGWGGGKLNATTVLLDSLPAGDSEALLDELGAGLDPEARARVIAASQGNPLFLEEMVALARERGTVEVPPTIQALLAARLERLGVEERALLERGAVEGEVFHRLAVQALADERLAAEVELRLAGLVRKELIRPHPATFDDDDAFRFRHLLIRDAAYDGLPKAERAELHERFARWLEEAGGGLVELDEIAGWHLEQVIRYRRELGREVDPQLAYRAAEHLFAAGRRAGTRNDTAAARSLLDRAFALAPEAQTLHALIAVDLADQLMEAGEFARVEGVLSQALENPETNSMAELTRLEWLHHARPHEALAAIEATLPALLQQFEAAGNQRGLAKAHMTAFWLHWGLSQATEARRELLIAVGHATTAGEQGLRARALAASVAPLVYGPWHAKEMTTELDQIERKEHGPYVRGFVEWGRAVVARLEGRFDDARTWIGRSGETLGSLGNVMAEMADLDLADIEWAAGNFEAARALLERGDAQMLKAGEEGFRSTTRAQIAQLNVILGDYDAARVAADQALELSAPEDVINYVIVHEVRAQLALVEGNLTEAERWARSAVEHAATTDFVTSQARARLQLATVLAAAGRREEAAAAAREARSIYESKGDRPGEARARSLLDVEPWGSARSSWRVLTPSFR